MIGTRSRNPSRGRFHISHSIYEVKPLCGAVVEKKFTYAEVLKPGEKLKGRVSHLCLQCRRIHQTITTT